MFTFYLFPNCSHTILFCFYKLRLFLLKKYFKRSKHNGFSTLVKSLFYYKYVCKAKISSHCSQWNSTKTLSYRIKMSSSLSKVFWEPLGNNFTSLVFADMSVECALCRFRVLQRAWRPRCRASKAFLHRKAVYGGNRRFRAWGSPRP